MKPTFQQSLTMRISCFASVATLYCTVHVLYSTVHCTRSVQYSVATLYCTLGALVCTVQCSYTVLYTRVHVVYSTVQLHCTVHQVHSCVSCSLDHLTFRILSLGQTNVLLFKVLWISLDFAYYIYISTLFNINKLVQPQSTVIDWKCVC